MQGVPVAHIREIQFDNIVALDPAVDQLGRRNDNALLEDGLGRGHDARRLDSTGIELMAARHGPEHLLAVHEDRLGRHQVRDMGVTPIGIVRHIHVAVVDVVSKHRDDFHQQGPNAVAVDGQAIGHGDLTRSAGMGVVDHARVVAGQGDDRGPRRLLHRQGHLLTDGFKAVTDHTESDGVERCLRGRQGDGINLTGRCHGFTPLRNGSTHRPDYRRRTSPNRKR